MILKKYLGRNRKKIATIGLGTGDYFWNSSLSNFQKIEIIRKAVDNGIQLIDTAEEYGNGISENIIGEAIQDFRDKVIISSKFSPQNNGYKEVINSCEKSLKRLKTDFIDIYQIHWPNPAIRLEETIEALIKLYNDGKISNIGVSNFSFSEIKKAQKYLGNILLSTIQMEYNLFERTIDENGISNYCEDKNILLLAYSPLDQGQMSIISPLQKKTLARLAQKHMKSIYQIILNFIISKPSNIAIMRTTSIKHLMDNIQTMNFTMDNEDILLIENTFPIEYCQIPVSEIDVSENGEWNHKIYTTIIQAKENKLGFTPSPKDLSKTILDNGYLKPVRLKPSLNDKNRYELVGGRIRYWAWRIAYGENCPDIPAYIRKEYES